MRRSPTAVCTADRTSSTAVSGERTRRGTAPTDAAIASWSIRKFDRTAAAAVSAASTSSGVRLLAASVMPVIALVSPQPWCRVRTPSSPLVRA